MSIQQETGPGENLIKRMVNKRQFFCFWADQSLFLSNIENDPRMKNPVENNYRCNVVSTVWYYRGSDVVLLLYIF